jgi:hypothetical protein
LFVLPGASSLGINIPPLSLIVGALHHVRQEGIYAWTRFINFHRFLFRWLGRQYNCCLLLLVAFIILTLLARILFDIPEMVTLLLLGNALETLLFYLVGIRQLGSLLLPMAGLFQRGLRRHHGRGLNGNNNLIDIGC